MFLNSIARKFKNRSMGYASHDLENKIDAIAIIINGDYSLHNRYADFFLIFVRISRIYLFFSSGLCEG